MKLDSQNNKILISLLQGEKITPLDALEKYDCLRLASRIYDLKEKGFKIKTDTSKRYATYSM